MTLEELNKIIEYEIGLLETLISQVHVENISIVELLGDCSRTSAFKEVI